MGEWAVLALVDEGPDPRLRRRARDGPGGDVGRVWSMRRPLVYRTFDVLESRRADRDGGDAAERVGPPRTLVQTTAEGAQRSRWLATPVEHVRDARSALMLKLLFLDRRDKDPAELLAAQREKLVRSNRTCATRSTRPTGSPARSRSGGGKHGPQSGSWTRRR